MPGFLCPDCWNTSYHPTDVARGYCPGCRAFTGASQPCVFGRKRPKRPTVDPNDKPTALEMKRYGYKMLATHAQRGEPFAQPMLDELDRLKPDLALIPRGTLSKYRTHRWTGRRWQERDA